MTAPAVVESKLPASLGWYRDAANWVVGLSTGALAAGITQLERIGMAAQPAQVVFALATMFFLLAVVSGIQFYFWLTSYGNAREHRDRLEATAARSATRDAQLTHAESTLSQSERRFGFFHDAMIWTFHLGILGFAFVALWLLIGDPKHTREWSIAIAACDSAPLCPHRRSYVIKVEKHTGEARYLIDSQGIPRWIVIGDETASAAARATRRPPNTTLP